MSRVTDPEIINAVEAMVRDRFPEAAIERVLVTQEEDLDGDKILSVLVIFGNKPDVSRIKGLARNIWDTVSDRGGGFPVLSFRSSTEHNKLMRAAA